MVDLQKSFFDPRFSLRKERANAFEGAEITGEGGPFTTGPFSGEQARYKVVTFSSILYASEKMAKGLF